MTVILLITLYVFFFTIFKNLNKVHIFFNKIPRHGEDTSIFLRVRLVDVFKHIFLIFKQY